MKPRSRRFNTKAFLIVVIIGVATFFTFPFILGFTPAYGAPELAFPIANPSNITRMSAFGTPDWGEPGKNHNGIDLAIIGHNGTEIVSPCTGYVTQVEESTNPYSGILMFSINIMVNYFFSVKLVLEPYSNDTSFNAHQRSLISVRAGQRLMVGDHVALLLEGPDYPHLHYMVTSGFEDVCAYQYSSASAKTTFDAVALATNSSPCYVA
jgi:hypothetical protein